jgi:hypothetical protein
MNKTIAEITPINEPFSIGENKETTLQTYIVRFGDFTSGLLYWNTQYEFKYKEGDTVGVTSENMSKPFKFGNETFNIKVRLTESGSNDTSVKSDTTTPQQQKSVVRPREESIVFQNQSHLIQQYFTNCNICPDLMDINLATDLQVRWATEGFSKELMERFEKFQQYIEEKYKG